MIKALSGWSEHNSPKKECFKVPYVIPTKECKTVTKQACKPSSTKKCFDTSTPSCSKVAKPVCLTVPVMNCKKEEGDISFILKFS